MDVFYFILFFLIAFLGMEFMAWFTHKYIMHGFLWKLHKDHHRKDHDNWWERNDLFFVFYAVVCIGFILLWKYDIFWAGLPVGIGIFSYGLTYFFVHDIFIHQRFKIFRTANNKYAKAVRRAHKMHHKHLGKDGGECFGMLVIPMKYLKNK